jgi:hypothetical protein
MERFRGTTAGRDERLESLKPESGIGDLEEPQIHTDERRCKSCGSAEEEPQIETNVERGSLLFRAL